VLHRRKKSRTSKVRISGLSKIGPSEIGPLITFTAFSGPVPPARYKDALDQIDNWREHNRLSPLRGERLEECEREVIIAVRSVEFFKEGAPYVITPKNNKKMLEKDAKALRAAAEVRSSTRVWELRRLLLEEATKLDRRAAVKQPPIVARKQAVDLAERILTHFGENAPGLTLDGPWHRLSEILFGVRRADVFQTMRLSRKSDSRP
jgi:hypothetical protein